MKLIITVFAILCISGYCGAIIRTVAADGSAHYSNIQAAINNSSDGDTVLVMPGRYYENITFGGRAIILTSNNLFTNNPLDIANTVLDGNNNGAVIRIINDEQTATLYGFTIVNGSGYTPYDNYHFGGGVVIHTQSNEVIHITKCTIMNNTSDDGGGLYIGHGNVRLSGNSIRNNHAKMAGGGIAIGSSSSYNVTFDAVNRCSVYNNYANSGADIASFYLNSLHVVVDTFTVANPWNFFAGGYATLPSITNPYTFNILHSVFQEVNHDLYVSPQGDDSNSGLSPQEPMKTIAKAVYRIASDSINPKTVYLMPGVYSTSLNGQWFPIPLKSSMRLQGANQDNTILDGDGVNICILTNFYNRENIISSLQLRNSWEVIHSRSTNKLLISDVTIQDCSNTNIGGIITNLNNEVLIYNTKITNCIAYNPDSGTYRTGIYINDNKERVEIRNVEVSNCTSYGWLPVLSITQSSGEVIVDRSRFINNHAINGMTNSLFQFGYRQSPLPDNFKVKMSNCLFSGNTQNVTGQMGVLNSRNSISLIENCTFADNSGGSVLMYLNGDVELKNNVFYNPAVNTEIVIPNFTSPPTSILSNVWLDYNCIRNGQNGVHNDTSLNHLYWGVGNISENPLFCSGANAFYLLPNSPLIDAGNPQTGWGIQEYDLAGNIRIADGNHDGISRIDMGAYEYQYLAAPTELAARTGTNTIHLSWTMNSDRSLSGFRIYRDGIAIGEITNSNSMNYIDRDFSQSDTLIYRIAALYGQVESMSADSVTVVLEYVANNDETVTALTGLSISPNPFANNTQIRFTLKERKNKVDISVYNLKGQRVKTLVDKLLPKGEHLANWDGTDSYGNPCKNGVYLIRYFESNKSTYIRKVTLLR